MKRYLVLLVVVMIIAPWAVAQMAVEKIDTVAMAKIRDEGLNRSQIMETISYLTDVYGPRLAWSPDYNEAAAWAKKRMESWGLENAHFDTFAPVARGWTLKKLAAHVVSPRPYPLIAYAKAWSPATRGTVRGDAVYLDVNEEADFEKYKGKLKGAVVLLSSPRAIEAHWEAFAKRNSDSELLEMANAGPQPSQAFSGRNMGRFAQAMRLAAMKLQFIQKEGALASFEIARVGDGGTVFVQGATLPQSPETPFTDRVAVYSEAAAKISFPPQFVLTPEHYNRMVRQLDKGQKVKVELNLEVEFTKADSSINIIAEIPGTDLKNEIVMVGGHFDSWHGGTGATDNATGSAVAMEALRILKATGLQPRRTIRIGLWGAEEQGLNGSRGYVAKHLGEREGGRTNPTGPVKTKAGYETFSAYFNNDNGTGKVRGVYMQGNEAARTIFREWLKPFADLGATTLTLDNTGGTDHLGFDAIGLPGFQFIQDPVEYDTRTHHSNMDVYDRVQEADVKQGAILMAAFAYNAAMRDEMFPRKPKPAPRPQQNLPGGN